MLKTTTWRVSLSTLLLFSLLLLPASLSALTQASKSRIIPVCQALQEHLFQERVSVDNTLAHRDFVDHIPQAQASQNQAPQKSENGNVVDFSSKFFPDLAQSGTPLTVRQKFKLFPKNSVSLGAIVGSTFGATIGQASNSLEGYGQGVAGYAKRFGSSMASGATNNLLGTFLIPSLTRQDPRYFVLQKGSLAQHVGHAANRFVFASNDSGGGDGINWGGLLGPLGAEVVANSYLPVKEQTGAKTMARYGTRQASRFGINVLKELWPGIIKKLTGK